MQFIKSPFLSVISCFVIWLLPYNLYSQYVVVKDSTDANSITKKTIHIDEVEVKAKLSDANIKSGSTGLTIDVKEIKLLPKLVGESDPYKALQYMGGVSQAGEANSGLYVRGGNNDQNLVMLNASQIQNPTHVLGIFSVFNPDLIDQMKFIKSGIPAEYGGRLSSVVDINTSSFIPDKTKIDGSLGLISSRITVHTPLSEKASVYGSLRGSYISSIVLPLLTKIGIDTVLTSNKYEFWDANAGFLYKINKKTKLSGHLYIGRDDIGISQFKQYNVNENTTYWQNTVAGLQLNHIFSPNFSLNNQVSFSGFDLSSNFNWYNSVQNLSSKSQIINYRADFFYFIKEHKVRFGTEASYNMAYPHFVETDSIIPIELSNQHNNIFSSLLSIYARDEWNWKKWQFNVGVRGNMYTHLGPYNDFQNNELIRSYKNNEFIKTYYGVEPRFYSRYLINKSGSLKLAATYHLQYLNQIPILNFGVPADLQIPTGLYVQPQGSWHFSGGYFQNLHDNDWETSIEGYYKTLENQFEFKSSVIEVFTNTMVEKDLLVGKGWTYGAEFKLRRNTGKLTGWLSYNLAWNYRQFDEINEGRPYLARNDRRHDLSLVGIYQMTPRWNVSAVFVYATGSRLNLPLSWYIIDNKVILEYGRYNAFVMPAYHRLDFSANYKLNPIMGIRSELNLSVYNVYNRANPFHIYFITQPENGTYSFKLHKSYLLPIIPSISWVFHL